MTSGHPPKRILHFLWRLSESGGVQRVVRNLLRDIDKERFHVHVCTVRPLWDEDRLDDLGSGIELHSLGMAGEVKARRRATAALALRRTIRRIEPDLVHVHSGTAWYLLPWLKLPGRIVPVVCEIHDSPQSERVSPLNNRLESLVLRHTRSTALTHSVSVAREVEAGLGTPSHRIEVIPIGIDLAPFAERRGSGPGWRRRVSIADDALVVSYVARLVATKNVDLFLQVAAAVLPFVPRAHFVLIGEGPERRRLELESVRMGLAGRVTFTGYEPRIADILDGSDVFLSTSDYEGFGIAILEAMAAETAVVATDVGGTSGLVVQGVTGMLAPRGDVAALADALKVMLNDNEIRARMAAAGKLNASRLFDVATMVRQYEALYDRLTRDDG